ncbi:MAG: sodium:solute symporter [Verrucomicrobiota bacterium]
MLSGIIDLGVVAVYFIVVLAIGLWKGRGENDMEGFALGDRQIPWWAVLASILAAEISAATFLGAPAEGFNERNFHYAQLVIGTVLARILVAYIFIKPYYDYNVVSIYEFLQKRFGNKTKTAASGVFLITRALASGTRLYVAAIILVLGFEMFLGHKPTPHQEFMIYLSALLMITVITAIYTAYGGIKAVVWTDLIQVVVLFGALGFTLISLFLRIPGGWDGISEKFAGHTGSLFINSGLQNDLGGWNLIKHLLEEPYTLFAAFIGSTFLTMSTHGTDQDMVQRMLTAKDHHKSRWALISSGLADLPVVLAFLSVGMLLWVFYQFYPDPQLPEKHPFAYYILHEMPTGIRGLVVAGLFATAMGSLSTALNALATSYTRDWHIPFIHPQAEEKEILRVARWSTAIFSVILIVIGAITAWVVIQFPGARVIPIVLGIFGYTYGSMLGIFMLGALTKTRGSESGNLIAMLVGFVVVAWLSDLPNDLRLMLGWTPSPRPSWLPTIAFVWRIFFGTITTFLIAALFRTPESKRVTFRDHRS